MKVMSVVGARPQFVKLGPIAHQLRKDRAIEHILVHTGQHYDSLMSDAFFDDLGIAQPHVNLGVGSGSHGVQTGAMLSALDPVMKHHRPDWTIVYGDTNSTLAATLSAVKLHLRVAHLEAGLRSFNREMPEEHNRILVDHASDLLLAPTENALAHLRNEGLGKRSVNVGDIMTDVCLATRDRVQHNAPHVPCLIDSGAPYLIATVHRAENTDDPVRLARIISVLQNLPISTVLYAHPRLAARCESFGLALQGGSLISATPLAYSQLIRNVMGAGGVITDSGGLQKEAFLLRIPCTTIRTETEWIETLEDGWNILDPELTLLPEVAYRKPPPRTQSRPYGDGHTASRVVRLLKEWVI
jgi:UDP-N-acetylglucosamine 2-epimerase (non-hydrolysing)